jgi:DNA polymerase III subunit alpha
VGECSAPRAATPCSIARRAATPGPAPRPPEPPRGGDDLSVAGIVGAVRQLKTRKGDRMAVFTLEDRHGGVEVVVFPEAFGRCGALVETGRLVLVRGKRERDDEQVQVLASEICGIEVVRERLATELAITVAVPPHGRPTFEALADLFAQHRGDKPVVLQLELRSGPHALRVHAQVSSQIRVKPSPVFLAEVQRLCGDGSVELR